MEQDRQFSPQPSNLGDLKKRIVFGAVLALPVLVIVYFGGPVFTMLVVAAAIILTHEWKNLIAGENEPKARLKLEILGIIYITLPATALIWLREIADSYGIDGRDAVFWVILTVWSTDIAGYFVGRKFGDRKLAPTISPNKTWNGAFGALAAALILSIILTPLMKPQHTVTFIAATLLMSVVSQVGDLLESWIKRKFGAKDSGSLIPGHGGFFDRVDGLMAAAVFTALIIGAGVFK